MPNGASLIAAAPTSVAAFVGRARQGPTDRPHVVRSFLEFDQLYGGLWAESPMTSAVRHFFLNGGSEALVCRLPDDPAIDNSAVSDASLESQRQGLWMLDHADRFNLLCIPPIRAGLDVNRDTWDAAAAYAKRRRAMLLVDPPAAWTTPADVTPNALGQLLSRSDDLTNAVLYFPRVRAVDPLRNDEIATWAPSGAVAGVYARTDALRGVWKAPAGRDAGLAGVTGLAMEMSDAEAGPLNARGVCTLRSFPGTGPVVWGARTMSSQAGTDWRYVPVRRLALFIEESVTSSAGWIVDEPNTPALWERVRQAIGAFMEGLFRQGALQGTTSRDAWFVRCDATTNTQQDIDGGVVNTLVGFAPVKPAEFILLRIALRAA